MFWIISLIVAFVCVVVIGEYRFRRIPYSGLKSVNHRSTIPSTVFNTTDLRNIAVKKTALIGLFLLFSPRKNRRRPLPLPVKSHEIPSEEINLLVAESLNDQDNPLHWPLVYAKAYYNAHPNEQQAWGQFLQGLFQFTTKHSPAQALTPLKNAVASGFLPAYPILGDLYALFGDTGKAIETVRPASQANYAPAIHQHAYYIYLESLGKLFQYRRKAAYTDLFKKSARLGYPPSAKLQL